MAKTRPFCTYQSYDPVSLEPLNEETRQRLDELHALVPLFDGKTVLDIGCNAGLASVMAVRGGASRVAAVDVDVNAVDHVSKVVAEHQMPIRVRVAAFGKLDPSEDRADVVLALEVLHWVLAQGGHTMDEAVARLTALTGETLVIETPWSVTEPSIAVQTKLTEDDYGMDLLFDSLLSRFREIRAVHFSKYFGKQGASKRVLLVASGKREERLAPDAAAQSATLVPEESAAEQSPAPDDDPSYVKNLLSGARLAEFPLGAVDMLLGAVAATEPTTIVPPLPREGSYVREVEGKRQYVMSRVMDTQVLASIPPDTDRAYQVYRMAVLGAATDLRRIPDEMVSRAVGLGARVQHRDSESTWLEIDAVLQQVPDWTTWHELARALLERAAGLVDEDLDGLVHGDMHPGNVLLQPGGKVRIVDLDNLSPGPRYADALMALTWFGANQDQMSSLLQDLHPVMGRDVEVRDFAFAFATLAGWAKAMASRPTAGPRQPIVERTMRGISTLLAVFSERIAAGV